MVSENRQIWLRNEWIQETLREKGFRPEGAAVAGVILYYYERDPDQRLEVLTNELEIPSDLFLDDHLRRLEISASEKNGIANALRARHNHPIPKEPTF